MQDPGPAVDPSAMQNALMLQAIKGGAMGGLTPSAQMPSAPGMTGGGGSAPSSMGAPVDPGSMQGGLGMPQMQAAMQQQAQPQQDPLMSALMSQIPGGGQ